MGKSKSATNPNGKRRVEGLTGKKLAPKALRKKRRYLDDCTDAELASVGVVRRTQAEIIQGE